MPESPQSTNAARVARHRVGVATMLREIRAETQSLPQILAEMRAIRREVEAMTGGLVDTMADEKGARQ